MKLIRPSPETIRYFSTPARLKPLTFLLSLAAVFVCAAIEDFGATLVILVAFGLIYFFRAPRWLSYGTLGLALVVFISLFVFQLSEGPTDSISDRDEQLEYATRGFLAGKNPWTQLQPSGNPNSSGPSGVLIALLPVVLFDRLNELTFVFYLLLFGFLLSGDVGQRNDSFPLLGLLFINGYFGFRHTLLMSLEELYYGYLAMALAWLLLKRGSALGAGACMAFAILERPSYALPVFGFLCWYLYSKYRSPAATRGLFVGGLAAGALIVAPFVVVVGADLLRNNPFSYPGRLLQDQWPETNILFSTLNRIRSWLGPTLTSGVKIVSTLGLIALASRALRDKRLGHPFWHLCIGGFLADMLVYYDDVLFDYLPFFAIPAFMALAHTPTSAASADSVRESPQPSPAES